MEGNELKWRWISLYTNITKQFGCIPGRNKRLAKKIAQYPFKRFGLTEQFDIARARAWSATTGVQTMLYTHTISNSQLFGKLGLTWSG